MKPTESQIAFINGILYGARISIENASKIDEVLTPEAKLYITEAIDALQNAEDVMKREWTSILLVKEIQAGENASE